MITVAGVVLAIVAAGGAVAAPAETRVELRSAYSSPGLPLAETGHLVYAIHIEAHVDAKGEGGGRLTLIVTPPNYDEYGDLVTGTETDQVDRTRNNGRPPVVRECTIEFVASGAVGRVNQPPTRRSLFRMKGPEIESVLFIATPGPGLASGRLLVHGKDGRVEHVVELREVKPAEEGPPVPCHPGCFPAGTLVTVPGGRRRIETLRVGDLVTTVGPDGAASEGAVKEMFATRNALIKVRTDGGTVVTTAEQPLCLVAGGFRRAGNLAAGDQIWRWQNGRRITAVVREVVPTGREEPVFNLILGDSAVFVARDFLARGKPPAAPARAGE